MYKIDTDISGSVVVLFMNLLIESRWHSSVCTMAVMVIHNKMSVKLICIRGHLSSILHQVGQRSTENVRIKKIVFIQLNLFHAMMQYNTLK